jgi:hypothetical protein
MRIREFRTCIVIFFLALACIVVAVPGYARTDFDGDWNIFIVTREGACDPTLRYAVKIADGTVINDGVSRATVGGRAGHRTIRQPMGQRFRAFQQDPWRRRLARPRYERHVRRHLGGGTAAVSETVRPPRDLPFATLPFGHALRSAG